jgi:hypothetical protein
VFVFEVCRAAEGEEPGGAVTMHRETMIPSSTETSGLYQLFIDCNRIHCRRDHVDDMPIHRAISVHNQLVQATSRLVPKWALLNEVDRFREYAVIRDI